MLKKIELINFVSHNDNTISLKPGITVFIGHNGSGKSSVIDGITFALFGKHTRPLKKGVIKYGTPKGQASVEFTVNGKDYKAIRSITVKGTTKSELFEISDNDEKLIAQGERTQLGDDTMSNAIEKTIGLDFEKIKIASIVQQGELEKIIKTSPKEFRELLNSIITIDKLDYANAAMKEIKEKFRDNIKNQWGYDDKDIGTVSNIISDSEEDVKKSEPELEKLTSEKIEQEKKIFELKQEIEKLQTQELKIHELEARKGEIFEYLRLKMDEIKGKNEEIRKKILDCENSFSSIRVDGDVEPEINEKRIVLENISKEILELSNKKSELNANVSLAEQIKLKDGKCPICNSEVDHLNELFQIEHIKQETNSIENNISKLRQKQNEIQRRNTELEKIIEKQRDAKAILKANNINDKVGITKLKEELSEKEKQLDIISNSVKSQQISQLASIDTHTKQISDNILKLNDEVKGFDQMIFSNLKEALNDNENSLRRADTEFGAITARLDNAKKILEKSLLTLKELKIVRDYVSKLEKIQETVFKVDGPVAKSLRSWAFNTISHNASHYLEMLNTKINKIQIKEEGYKPEIICKRGSTEYNIGSLSGGEKVTVAIAVRLGMAHLLESSKLNFMIMDEPTNGLDTEHRMELVKVLTQLSKARKLNSESPLQLIIITHDREIFENADVDNIYKFHLVGDETRIEKM